MLWAVLASLFLGLSCARYTPTELHSICLRTERLGYLYGRTVMYNTAGAKKALNDFPWSHRGKCVAGAQGDPTFLQVCLVASTECGKDRATRVPEEHWPYFMDKYPGSFMCRDQSVNSECQECNQEPDDCFTGHGGPAAQTGCLQYDKVCNLESRRK
jgi:hypothetical protein